MVAVIPEGQVFLKDRYFEQTDYTPHQAQQEIHYDNTRHRILSNGRRWGKTLLGGKESECMAFVRNYLGQPCQGWIIGPQYSDCEKEYRVIYDTFRALGVDQVSNKFLNNVENGNMHIHTRWGFDIQCRSAAHPETLTGEGLDFVICAEAGKHVRKMFTEYVRPALSDKRGWSLMTGVPEIASDSSLLYWAWERGQDPNKTQWKSWRMPSWTNPVAFPGGRNDPEILEAEDDLTEDEFARQYEGKFVERVGRVMKEWDDDIHLVSGLEYDPARGPLYAALDYGYTNDWVWLWIQTDVWNNVYVVGEKRWRQMDSEEVCEDVLQDDYMRNMLARCAVIYAPPAEPSDTNIVRRKLEKPTATNTGGEINPRDQLTRRFLKQRPEHLPDGHPDKQPRLKVNRERCSMLAWEMRNGYRWPEHKNENKNAPENPVDKDNHGPEALGRFMQGHMAKFEPIRRARQGRVKVRRR